MANLRVSDSIAAALQELADMHGCTQDQVAEDILAAHLHSSSMELSAEDKAHILRSIEQARLGELIPGEQIEKFLDKWQAELDAR